MKILKLLGAGVKRVFGIVVNAASSLIARVATFAGACPILFGFLLGCIWTGILGWVSHEVTHDLRANLPPEPTISTVEEYVEPETPPETIAMVTEVVKKPVVAATEAVTEETVETTEDVYPEATSIPEATKAAVEIEPVETEPPTEAVIEKEVYPEVPLSSDLKKYILRECKTRGVHPAIIFGMIRAESTFNPNCVGDGGNSRGLMQIQARYHRDRMHKLGCTDLFDPYDNVTVGIDLFADLKAQGGSITWALMAYNGGPGYANRLASQGIVSGYAKTVLSYARGYGYDG